MHTYIQTYKRTDRQTYRHAYRHAYITRRRMPKQILMQLQTVYIPPYPSLSLSPPLALSMYIYMHIILYTYMTHKHVHFHRAFTHACICMYNSEHTEIGIFIDSCVHAPTGIHIEREIERERERERERVLRHFGWA